MRVFHANFLESPFYKAFYSKLYFYRSQVELKKGEARMNFLRRLFSRKRREATSSVLTFDVRPEKRLKSTVLGVRGG